MFSTIIHGMLSAPKPSDYWTTNPNQCFSELIAAKRVSQRNNQSVFTHTMHVLDALQLKNPFTLMAALFHDLGKAEITVVSPFKGSVFPNHASISTRIARQRLQLWQVPSKTIDQICRLIETHMFDITLPLSDKTISKFVANVGRNNIDNWFILRIADSAAYRCHKWYCRQLIDPFRIKVDEYLNQLPGIIRFVDEEIDTNSGMQIEGGSVDNTSV